MTRVTRLAIAVAPASWLITIAAAHLGLSWSRWLMAPALMLTGYALMVDTTRDVDSPLSWGHKEESQGFWQRNALQLLINAVLFGFSLWLTVAEWPG